MLTSIVRSMDDLGRVVVLKEWRRDLGIEPGSPVDISRNGNVLIIALGVSPKESTGIVRKIDNLGRVVIPKEWREKLKIGPGTPIEMARKGNKITLGVKSDECCVCGRDLEKDEIILRLHSKGICNDCKNKIAKS